MNHAQAFKQAAPHEWNNFCTNHALTAEQQQAFALFGSLLLEWNQKHNLTAITQAGQVINDHFQDSLSITEFVAINSLRGFCDVGTGGGFPGIPLKIMYPTIPVVLIEVNNKKIAFLKQVIQELGLHNIEVSSLDWRTFVRKTNYELDLFCARASLRPDELVRMFTEEKSHYKKARLVYWASRHWQLADAERRFFEKEEEYTIHDKVRRLIFFKK